MAEYISEISELVDTLTLARDKTSNNDIVLFALASLSEDDDVFVKNVATGEIEITSTQLQGMLLDWEIWVEWNVVTIPPLTTIVGWSQERGEGFCS